jgi:5'-methylthioadenosine phosphorylase
MTVGLILGSAYHDGNPLGLDLIAAPVATPYGEVVVHRVVDCDAVVLFRHGLPHRWLPHQIPYRAHAAALARAGATTLVVTSSVGVLDPDVPLHRPLLVEDLIMLENRLPDGSACTMFETPSREQGHLVLDEGLFSPALAEQVDSIAATAGMPVAKRVVFAYAQGPRTKSAAENRAWRRLGADVNSMSVGPEVVLANELAIPTVALVIGHKYSVAGVAVDPGDGIRRSLESGRGGFDHLLRHLIEGLRPVPFGNRIYRFDV